MDRFTGMHIETALDHVVSAFIEISLFPVSDVVFHD